jgi:hypothetical protein
VKKARAGFVIAVAWLLASCGNPVESVMSGTWNLETLNGKPIPVQLASTPVSRVLIDAKLLIYPDGTYGYDFDYSVREGLGPFKREAAGEEGEWVRNGDDITLINDATGAKMTGRVFGTRMRLTSGTDVHDFYLILIDPTLDGGKDSRMTGTNQD